MFERLVQVTHNYKYRIQREGLVGDLMEAQIVIKRLKVKRPHASGRSFVITLPVAFR